MLNNTLKNDLNTIRHGSKLPAPPVIDKRTKTFILPEPDALERIQVELDQAEWDHILEVAEARHLTAEGVVRRLIDAEKKQ